MDTIELQHSLDDDYKRHDLYEQDLHSENEKLIRSINGLLPSLVSSDGVLEDILNSLTQDLKSVSDPLRLLVGLVNDPITDTLNDVLDAVDGLLSNVLDLLLDLIGALLNLVGRLLGVTNDLKSAVNQLLTVVNQLKVLNEIKDLAGNVPEIDALLDSVLIKLGKDIERLTQIVITNTELKTAVSQLTTLVGSLKSNLGDLKSLLSSALVGLLENISDTLSEIAPLVEGVTDVTDIDIDNLTSKLLNLNSYLNQLINLGDDTNNQALQNVVAQVNELAGILQQLPTGLKPELEAVIATFEDLVEVITSKYLPL
jgi:archaellum component FlaC